MGKQENEIKRAVDKHQKFLDILKECLIDGTKDGVKKGIPEGIKKAGEKSLGECLKAGVKGVIGPDIPDINAELKAISATNEIVDAVTKTLKDRLSEYIDRFLDTVIGEKSDQDSALEPVAALVQEREEQLCEEISHEMPDNPVAGYVMDIMKEVLTDATSSSIKRLEDRARGRSSDVRQKSEALEFRDTVLKDVRKDLKNIVTDSAEGITEEYVCCLILALMKRSVSNLSKELKEKLQHQLSKMVKMKKFTKWFQEQSSLDTSIEPTEFIKTVDMKLFPQVKTCIGSIVSHITPIISAAAVIVAGAAAYFGGPLIPEMVNASPVAVPGIESIDNLVVNFTGDDSYDEDGNIAGWHWEFGDSTEADSQNPQHTYLAGGTYIASLCVRDNHNKTCEPVRVAVNLAGGGSTQPAQPTVTTTTPTSSTSTVTSTTTSPSSTVPGAGKAPIAEGRLLWTDGYTVGFSSAGSYDPDGNVAGLEWGFGDGGTSNEENPEHEYPGPGVYTVSLVVIDNDGNQGQTQFTVSLSETGPAPVWSEIPLPTEETNQLAPGTDIGPIAVASNRDIFVVGSRVGNVVYKSTDGGHIWTAGQAGGPGTRLVGLVTSPGYETDGTIMVLAAGPPAQVYISTDRGNNFVTLGNAIPLTGTSIAIAPTYTGGIGELLIGTIDPAAGAFGNVWRWGQGGAMTWEQQGLNEDITAVAFSPSYPIDATVLAVGSTIKGTYLHTKVATTIWNSVIGTEPVELMTGTGAITEFGTDGGTSQVKNTSIGIPYDFLGANEMLRTLFVAMRSDRPDDKVYKVVAGLNAVSLDPDGSAVDDEITSLAFSGMQMTGTIFAGNAATGAGDTAQVFRCENPMAVSPAWTQAAMPPTGTAEATGHLTFIASGAELYAATQGKESGISVSSDGGATFRQTGLIDTTISNIQDFRPVSSSEFFLLTANMQPQCPESLWNTSDGGNTWSRILTFGPALGSTTNDQAIVRITPDYQTDRTIYVAETGPGATKMMISGDGGMNWNNRTVPVDIGDVTAINNFELFLCEANNPAVRTTNNQGFTWSLPTAIPEPAHHLEYNAQTGDIMAISSTGMVFFFGNGDTSFEALAAVPGGGTTTATFASDFTATPTIYTGTDQSGDAWMWTIGASSTWRQIDNQQIEAHRVQGMRMTAGILFILTSDSINSRCWWSTDPLSGTPVWYTTEPQSTAGRQMSSLLSDGARLWAIDEANKAVLYCPIGELL